MTISYAGNFARLLVRWKGSLWKGVWKELLVYLICYYIIRLIYTVGLNKTQALTFENLARTCDNYTRFIPLTFLLGFYISSIVRRWWEQFGWVAWPDEVLSFVCLILPDGVAEDARLMRHAIARWLLLTAALSWRDVSTKVRQRFPTVDHIVACRLMTSAEYELYKSQPENVRWFLPLQWTQKLVNETIERNKLSQPMASAFFRELNSYRQCFRKLYCYDWVCIPLVYTQVAALATYGYFAFCLIGRQFLHPEEPFRGFELNYLDLYVPVFTIVQFLFYVGWFKVGQDLMRPFGTDDDDIELNYILDRHIQVSFALVNDVCDQLPPLVEDDFRTNPWVPHTKLSAQNPDHPPKLHSVTKMSHEEAMIEMIDPDSMIHEASGHKWGTSKKAIRQF